MIFLGSARLRSQPPNGLERNAAKEKRPIKNPICLGLPFRLSKKRGSKFKAASEEKQNNIKNCMVKTSLGSFLSMIKENKVTEVLPIFNIFSSKAFLEP